MFEVDRSWPKVPPNVKLGDASSFAIDAQDNVWLLHRPRTLKPDQAAMAGKPVMVFDTAGNFVKSWGGDGRGYDWPQREHGIHIDPKGFVWIGGNYCAALALFGLKPVADDALLKFAPDGKFVLQIGKSDASKGNADTANVHRAADAFVHAPTNEVFVADGYGNTRVVVFDADTGAFKRIVGRVRQSACGRRQLQGHIAQVRSRMPKARRSSTSCTPSAWPRTARSTRPTARTGACRRSATTASISSS